MKNLGVYIHIPFCSRKCIYCAFNSVVGINENIVSDYIHAVCKEIKRSDLSNFVIDSVFIGGGTPSNIKSMHIKSILEVLKDKFTISNNCEITIEFNPEDFSLDKISEYGDMGINRASIGLQETDNNLLKYIERNHTRNDFINTVKAFRDAGIDNISADILVGIPGQKSRNLAKTLRLIRSLKLPHISMYDLIYEENTKLTKLLNENKIKKLSDNKLLSMYRLASKTLGKIGLQRYEVSNFALSGFESVHNIKYWTLENYAGFGVSAHSFVKGIRSSNIADLYKYIDRTNSVKSVLANQAIVSEQDLREEFLLLGLRMKKGVGLLEYKRLFGHCLIERYKNQVQEMLDLGLISVKNNRLSLTNKGFELINSVILKFI